MTDLNQIQEIFDIVISLPPQERAAYLNKVAAEAPDLHQEVLDLLELESESQIFPDVPLMDQPEPSWVGREIGVYRLEKLLGKGGMGAVYLGVRTDDEIDMTVSIKLIQSRIMGEDVLKRFRRERQLLANLRHANIAMLLDAGTTGEGLPYFIMEYIEGLTIEKWYAAYRPSLYGLLQLFHKVIEAVGFAHANGVVHRDIKPGNLMVTHAGQPKLLDFGIAGVQTAESIANANRPKGQAPMTPQYASPEQLRGEDTIPAGDIYSLGLVLLQLLTGVKPGDWGCTPLEMVSALTIRGRNRNPKAPQEHQPCEDSADPPTLQSLDTTSSHPTIDLADNPIPTQTAAKEPPVHNDEDWEAIPEALGHVLRTALAPEISRRYQDTQSFISDLDRIPPPQPEPGDQLNQIHLYDLFLWYAEEDQDHAAVIAQSLREAGLRLWPGHNPLFGEPLPEVDPGAAASRCHACLVCLNNPNRAPWLIDTATSDTLAFRAGDIRIFPLLLPDAAFPSKESDLPGYLRGPAWITFPDGLDEPSLDYLVKAVKGIELYHDTDPDPTQSCPFRGLEVFREEDRRFFIGREAVTQRIVEYLSHHPFIGVLGPSGSGKSSVIQAGVIPTMRERGARIIRFTPNADPLDELAYGLAQHFKHSGLPHSFDDLKHRLHSDAQALHFIASELTADGRGPICIVADQFEEIFTLTSDPAAAELFVANLCDAAEQRQGNIFVIITMRSDFLGRTAAYPTLNTILLDHALQVGPMRQDDLARAIEVPARLGGLQLEDGLLERILKDVAGASGDLPLLEHALLELYERRKGVMLTNRAYLDIGGIEGALAQRAESEYAALDPVDQATLRKMFTLCLVQHGESAEDTRRHATSDELLATGACEDTARRLLLRWIDARMLTSYRDEARDIVMVDVAHEALIRQWPRIAEWMAADRELARQLSALRHRAQAWHEDDRTDDHLPRGGLLYQMRDLLKKDDVNPGILEREFVDAGIGLAEREARIEAGIKRDLLRRKNIAMTVGAMAVVLAAFAFVMYFRADNAEAKALEAKDRAYLKTREANFSLAKMYREEVADALDENNAETAWLYAFAALSRDIPQKANLPGVIGRFADSRMRDAEDLLWVSPLAVPVNQVAQSDDGSLLAMAGQDHRIRLIDTASGGPVAVLAGHSERIRAMAFCPNRNLLVSVSNDRTIRFWEPLEGAWEASAGTPDLNIHQGQVQALAFSDDGAALATATARGFIHLWRLNDDQTVAVYDTEAGPLNALSFDARGANLMFGSQTGVLGNIKLATDRITSQSTPSPITAMTRIRDRLISAHQDGHVRTWDNNPNGAFVKHSDFQAAASSPIAILAEPETDQITCLSVNGDINRLTMDGRPIIHHRAFTTKAAHPEGSLTNHKGRMVAALAGLNPAFVDQTGQPWAGQSGHSDIVWGLDLSPDGTILATASSDHTVRLWDNRSGRPLGVLKKHMDRVSSVAFSPDGSRLISVSHDDTALIWDLDTHNTVGKLKYDDNNVRSAAWSPDDRFIATGSVTGQVQIWDATDLNHRATLDGHTATVRDMAFSPNGRILAVVSHSRSLKLWDTHNWQPLTDISIQGANVHCVAFDPSGRLLALGAYDHRVLVYNLPTQTGTVFPETNQYAQLQTVLKDHDAPITSLSFSADGKWLVSASTDAKIKIWDTHNYRAIGSLDGHVADVTRIKVSPDGRNLVSASFDGLVRSWDLSRFRPPPDLSGHQSFVQRIDLSPTGGTLASISRDGTLRTWDTESRKPLGKIEITDSEFRGLSFSPDGRAIAVSDMNGRFSTWDTDTLAPKLNIKAHQGVVYSIAWSPDGNTLATGSGDSMVKLWDAQTGAPKRTLRGHKLLVRGLAWSPDSTRLASTSFDHSIRIWDVSSEDAPMVLSGHSSLVLDAAYSPDGKMLVTASEDRSARLWDTQTGQSFGVLTGHRHAVESAVFSHDGQYLATVTGEGVVHYWDIFTQTLMAEMSGRGHLVNTVAFAKDDRRLYSIGSNHNILIWELDDLLFFTKQNHNRLDYQRLFQRSLFHFGYRMDRAGLAPEPRFALEPQSGHKFSRPHPYDRLTGIRPKDTRLIQWIYQP